MWDGVGQFSIHAYFTPQVNYRTDRLITESDRGGGSLLTLLNLQTHSLWDLIEEKGNTADGNKRSYQVSFWL